MSSGKKTLMLIFHLYQKLPLILAVSPNQNKQMQNLDSSINNSLNQLQTKLQTWAASFCIPLIALTALLSILRSEFPDLPKDARTLLGTQTQVPVANICNGEYYHFGLINGLRNILGRISSIPKKLTTLAVQFNIDGIPMFKSSRTQFWPILATVDCDKTRSPFIIGLFCGNSKPSSVWEYLKDFTAEFKLVLQEGIVKNGTLFKIAVSSFICDAPARAFVKNVKSHNGYFGCDKCSQTGVWSNKMTYPETDAPLRTDLDYEIMKNEEHHLNNSLSPLTGLVKMVTQFPIDYMHTCCLGVTRRLIQMWMKGKHLRTRLPSKHIQEISDRLVALRPFMPQEFARKPRALTEVDRWKATEFRQFMLYTGPVVLKGFVESEIYDNFLLFSVGMFLLLSPGLSASMIEFANKVLLSFVRHYSGVYGTDEVVFNVHQVIHLAEEYKAFGPLDNISAFPNENYLGGLKRLVRKPDRPLQQVVKRLSKMLPKESYQSNDESHLSSSSKELKKAHFSDCVLSPKQGDNCIKIDTDIALIKDIIKQNESVLLVCQRFRKTESLYTYPCDSSAIGCHRVSVLQENTELVALSCVKQKYVLLPENENRFFAIPLLHCK